MKSYTCKPAQHPSSNVRGAALDLPPLAPGATTWGRFGREAVLDTSDDSDPVLRVPGAWA